MPAHLHAAPAIREALCRAVRSADDARTQKERERYLAMAFAYAESLRILSNSVDTKNHVTGGIAHREHLPMRAEQLAREFLGASAERILGPAELEGEA